MKYEMLVLTTVRSRIVVETDEVVPEVCRDGREIARAHGIVGRMMRAAMNYVAQNNLVAINLRDGNWSERAEYVGRADQESIDKAEELKLEEWDE